VVNAIELLTELCLPNVDKKSKFFFHHTQRGGSINGGKGAKTRLIPTAKWLQRRIVWLCGYDDDTILKWCNAIAAPTSQTATQDDKEEDDDDNVHDV
jgi:hypothetical protein